jgi:hypothetical protein
MRRRLINTFVIAYHSPGASNKVSGRKDMAKDLCYDGFR